MDILKHSSQSNLYNYLILLYYDSFIGCLSQCSDASCGVWGKEDAIYNPLFMEKCRFYQLVMTFQFSNIETSCILKWKQWSKGNSLLNKAANCLQTFYFYNTRLKFNAYLDTIDLLGYIISVEYHVMIGEAGQSLILW